MSKRIICIVASYIEICLFGAIWKGWPNIGGILEKEEFFSEHCPPIEVSANESCSANYCKIRATSIANVYSISVSFLGFGLFLLGLLYDWLNVFRTRIIIGVCISTSYKGCTYVKLVSMYILYIYYIDVHLILVNVFTSCPS